jgi:DNA-binding GntR family transcriptional regulator
MEPIEPLERHDTLADMAYDRLRSALMSGMFLPGETLSIRQLARVLEISATPARDAISRVLSERGLENGPHRTVIVPILTRERLAEIYAIRLSLEGLAAETAAKRFQKEDVSRLQKAQKAHLGAVNAHNYKAALAANEDFHFTIYERADNATLLEFIRSLWLKLGPSFNLLYPTYDRNRLGISHHKEIVQALKREDPLGARAAIQADLKDGWAELDRGIADRASQTAERFSGIKAIDRPGTSK